MKFKIDKELLDFTYIVRILKVVWSCSKKLTAYRFILLFFQALLPLIPLYLMKLLLDAFAAPERPEFSYIVWILVGFAAVKILSIFLANVMSYVGMLQADIVADHMSDIVISKAIETDLEYFDSDVYHDIFQRALAQASGRPLQVLGSITQMVQNGVSLLAILGLLFTLHWAVTIVLLVIAIPVALIRWYYTEKLVGLHERQTQRERKSFYFRQILTVADYAKEVRIFAFGKQLLRRFLGLRSVLRKEKRLLYLKQSWSIGLAQSVEAVAIIFALGFIAMRAIDGVISVGDIAMYYGMFQKGQSNINSVLKSLVSLHENRMYLKHLFDFLDLQKKIIDAPNPIEIPPEVKKIEFENVGFTYPNTKKEVISDVSFTVEKGELLAIVGENGSGKSTAVKLLNRLYEPSSGMIKINGQDISKFRIDDLRQKMTVIFQQFSKYNATVNENIQFADVHKPIDADRVAFSSDQAHASDFINSLPQGYNTQLGRSFHTGEELSGGEWQKIALSRAFYKDADLIILDEPTSFIDPLAEDDIFQNLRAIAKDKILILITHRIYNLKQANRIIVLDNGRIVESGSHSELMAQNGLYKKMFESQN